MGAKERLRCCLGKKSKGVARSTGETKRRKVKEYGNVICCESLNAQARRGSENQSIFERVISTAAMRRIFGVAKPVEAKPTLDETTDRIGVRGDK